MFRTFSHPGKFHKLSGGEGEGFDRPPAGPELRCARYSLARKLPLRHATGMSHLDALGFESYSHSKLKQPTHRQTVLVWRNTTV